MAAKSQVNVSEHRMKSNEKENVIEKRHRSNPGMIVQQSTENLEKKIQSEKHY